MIHRAYLKMAAWFLVLCLPLACDGDSPTDEATAAPVYDSCFEVTDCDEGLRCSTQGVAEIQLEAFEEGECREVSELVGSAPSVWNWQTGGIPLRDRLCSAQGLGTGSGEASDAIRSRQGELLDTLGVKPVRRAIHWERVEPVKGEFDFASFDPIVDFAQANDLEVVWILAYGNPWASSLTTSEKWYPPDDPTDYANYARVVAERYRGKVTRYELWNEANAGYRFFKPNAHGDAALYADMMVEASEAIHEVCPECTVISGGLFQLEQVINGAIEFTHDMLTHRKDVFDHIDVFGVHPYTSYPPQFPPELDGEGERALGGMLADIEAVLQLHDVPLMPFMTTEFGWPVYETVSEQVQADFLTRSVLLHASLGVQLMCWFNLVDGVNAGAFPPEDDFGLFRYGAEDVNQDFELKPSGQAMQWLSQMGEDLVPAGPNTTLGFHDPKQGQFALDFDSAAGTVTVVWQVEDETALSLDGDNRQRFNNLGALIDTSNAPLSAGPSPVFLVP